MEFSREMVATVVALMFSAAPAAADDLTGPIGFSAAAA